MCDDASAKLISVRFSGGDAAMTASPPFLCEASKAESTTDLAARFAVLGRFNRWAKLSDRCLCSGIVNLLCGALRHWAKRLVAADLVSVSVGGDDACTATPTGHGLCVAPLREERLHPIGCFIDGLVNECTGALLDQLASFVECLPHFWAHDAVCVWDESCDQSGRLTGTTRSC